jgi:hypothetical protein
MKKYRIFSSCKILQFLVIETLDLDCFDADPEPDPDPAQNLYADPDPDPDPDPGGGGGRSAKNVHPPWQNPRYAPGSAYAQSPQKCLNFKILAKIEGKRRIFFPKFTNGI